MSIANSHAPAVRGQGGGTDERIVHSTMHKWHTQLCVLTQMGELQIEFKRLGAYSMRFRDLNMYPPKWRASCTTRRKNALGMAYAVKCGVQLLLPAAFSERFRAEREDRTELRSDLGYMRLKLDRNLNHAPAAVNDIRGEPWIGPRTLE